MEETYIEYASLKDEMYSEMTKEIQQEIDSHLLVAITRQMYPTWIEVKVERNLAIDYEWRDKNIKGSHRHHSAHWFFEDKNDAANFIMVWA